MLPALILASLAVNGGQVRQIKPVRNLPHIVRDLKLPVTVSISIAGFNVNQPFRDGALDVGDSIYVHYDLYVFNEEGPTGPPMEGSSAIFGWSGNSKVNYQAGTGSASGGLKAGDEVPSHATELHPSAPRGRLPMDLPKVTITAGKQAILLIPTIWHADSDTPGADQSEIMQFLSHRGELAFWTMRQALLHPENVPNPFWTITNGPDFYTGRTWLTVSEPRTVKWDEPYGCIISQPEFGTNLTAFTPTALILTAPLIEDIIEGKQLPETQLNLGSQAPGLLYVRYADFRTPGDVTMYIRFQ